MKRRTSYAIALLLAAFMQVSARVPMREWFVAMPNAVLPLLTTNNKLDFIDYYDAKMEAIATNMLDGTSRMDTLTEDFISIQYTNSTKVEMKLLPMNDTTDIICMVTTAKANVKDSRIAFFDAEWRAIDVTTCFDEPRPEDFRTTEHSDSAQWAWDKMSTFFRTYHLSAEKTDLQCRITTLDHLSKEDRVEVAPYVRREPLTYRWINGTFVRNEQ